MVHVVSPGTTFLLGDVTCTIGLQRDRGLAAPQRPDEIPRNTPRQALDGPIWIWSDGDHEENAT